MKRLITLFTLFVLITLPALLLAQPSMPDGPEQISIDGGLGILATLGGAYAVKKLKERK